MERDYNAETMTAKQKGTSLSTPDKSWQIIICTVIVTVAISVIFSLIYRYFSRKAQPGDYVVSSDLHPREVEAPYLQAASKLLESASRDQAFANLETTLAYTWAHHQYYLATGQKEAINDVAAGIDHASTIMEQKSDFGPSSDMLPEQLKIDPAKIGLFCAMYQDIYQDHTLHSSLRESTLALCDQASEDFYLTPQMQEFHDRLEQGQAKMNSEASALYTYNPEYIIKEVTERLQSELQKFSRGGDFSWYDDASIDMPTARDNLARHLAATSNKYYRRQVFHSVSPTDDDASIKRLQAQNTRDQFDWLYLLGQTLSWYAHYGVSQEEEKCLLQQNLITYLHSSSAGDVGAGEILAYASPLSGTMSPECQVLAFYNYHPDTDTFNRQLNLASSEFVDEYTPTAEKLYLAGLLTQEEQEQTDHLERLGGVDISLPEGFENIYDELTQEDLDAVPDIFDTATWEEVSSAPANTTVSDEELYRQAEEYYQMLQEHEEATP